MHSSRQMAAPDALRLLLPWINGEVTQRAEIGIRIGLFLTTFNGSPAAAFTVVQPNRVTGAGGQYEWLRERLRRLLDEACSEANPHPWLSYPSLQVGLRRVRLPRKRGPRRRRGVEVPGASIEVVSG